ncbi:MAG: hypothetical protein WDZ35_04480 [Crocinitomicaceae bacterium]
MSQHTTLNKGEIYIQFTSPTAGKVSFKQLGITPEMTEVKGGFLRIVFDFEGMGEHDYFKVPTIEISYDREVPNTHWQCDFNGETLIDKIDHYGKSTIILLNRDRLDKLEHHHENKLILHAEFPEEVHLITEESSINFFK